MSRYTLIFVLSLGCWLHAQEYRSTLTGRVTDPTGAAVAGARVIATKTDTNSRFPTVSGPEGFYTVPLLPPGTYELSAEAPGFKKHVQSGIQIGSNERIGQNVELTVGSASESITVTSDAPPLDTVSASSGQSITTREVENLPINGRAPMDLAVMAYAVINTGVRDQNRPYENSGFSNFAMGGATNGMNEVLLDGVPNIGTLGANDHRAAFSPSVDAVSEVRVEAFNVDAAYGGSGGGTVEVVTKSGTNQMHGSLSEFNQASRLAATPYFTNASNSKKTVSRQNQYGGTVSGPVFLPKVFDGRNKLFFLFSYEGQKNSEPLPTYTTVPTDAERKGDFSQLLALGSTYQLYDPTTAKLSGSTVVRTGFSGNIIPPSRINAIASKYLSYINMPNFAGTANGTNNYFAPLTTNNGYHSYLGRGDVNISDRNKLSGRFDQSYWIQKSGNIFQNLALGENGLRSIWGAMLDDVHTFTPTLVANFRLGFTRYRAYYQQNSLGYDPTDLGFPSYIAGNATQLLMPAWSFSDGFLVASPATNLHYSDQPYNTYQAIASVTKVTGKHSIKAGAEYRVLDFSNLNWGGSTGTYTFATNWVQASSTAASQPLGGSMASFLLGLPTSGSYTINATSKNDSKYYVLFLHDDWRARSNLTLNAGLRWEYNTPTLERWDRMSNGFDAAATNQVTAAAAAAYQAKNVSTLSPLLSGVSFNAAGGLLFATKDNRAATSTPHHSFSPRFGISWSPAALKDRTVFRAGVGMFYYLYGVVLPQQPGFSATTTYVATNDSYLTPATTLSNPFPSGIAQPATQGVNTNLGQSIAFLNPNLQNQYSLRWSFDIQHQIAKDLVIELGYIGNHSVHLTTNYNFGSLPAKYLSTSTNRDPATINALGALITNPFAGLLPGTTMNGSTISVQNLLRPFPEFTGATENLMNNGGSYFYMGAIKIQKRFSHGMTAVVNYDHSRLMERVSFLNGGDLALENRVSTADRPDNFNIGALYELPFGRGKRFASGGKGVLNALVGNWAVSTLYSYHTGAPLPWTVATLIYFGGDIQYDPRNVNRTFDKTRFNMVSNQQLASNFRTFSSQFNNIRVDGTSNLNLTVTKEFALWEKVKLQYRADSFNVCNHALFAGANVTPTNAAFGTISSTTNTPRLIQMALRLTF